MPNIEVLATVEISEKELEKHLLKYLRDKFLLNYTWNEDGDIGRWISGYQDQMSWSSMGTVTPVHSAAKLVYDDIIASRGA